MPAYDPALCPRIERFTLICSANRLASAVVRFGGRQIPANGCAASSCVKKIAGSVCILSMAVCDVLGGLNRTAIPARLCGLSVLEVAGMSARPSFGTMHVLQLGRGLNGAGGILVCGPYL